MSGTTSSKQTLHLCCTLLGLGISFCQAEAPDPSKVVVIHNTADPESGTLATLYAEGRGIPRDRIVGLTAPLTEEISRTDFESTIAGPLREHFVKHGWWRVEVTAGGQGVLVASRVQFAVLLRGMPLKIAQGTPGPGDNPAFVPEVMRPFNNASVDSEIAALPLASAQISGAIPNPFHRSTRRVRDFSEAPMLLVTRLDGPTVADVQRMISDALETEQRGLIGWGWFDLRGITSEGYKAGDDWIEAARVASIKAGIPSAWDRRETVWSNGYPMTSAAVYMGWYAQAPVGPMTMPAFRFEKGAVAGHIFSFSAATLRDPVNSWCGLLVDRGACATFGNVYEPFLQFTTQPGILMERLLEGWTFAEAAYAGTHVLSWMNTFIGDPLYRPFKRPPGGDHPLYAAWRDGVKNASSGGKSGDAALQNTGKKLKSAQFFEALGLLRLQQGALEPAADAFKAARKLYTNDEDKLRTICHMVEHLRHAGRKLDALEMIDSATRDYSIGATSSVLLEIRREIAPPPPPPAASGAGLPPPGSTLPKLPRPGQ